MAVQHPILTSSSSIPFDSDPIANNTLISTGSFSGFRATIQELGHGYLTSERNATGRQPFCGNKEGWGPLSRHRYDFTPCFMDVWVSSVAVYGILFGAVAVWWLVRRKSRNVVERDWHFWLKQVHNSLSCF